MRRILAVAVALSALALGRGARASPPSPEDSGAEVLLGGLGPRKGAPSAEGVAKLVVLTEVGERDPRHEVVDLLRARGATAVVRFDPERMDRAFETLRRLAPGAVAVVVRPETLDVHFHFDLLERASRLDDDPFVDFAFGYFTGATPEEAVAFARGTAPTPGEHARSVLEFGPSTPARPLTVSVRHPWAKGFTTRRLAHAEGATDVATLLAPTRGVGVLSAWGHGEPEGVSGGLQGAHVRAAGLDLAGTLYFSGPCFCGVTDGWWRPRGFVAVRRRVAPGDSLLLALLGARATAVFAGLDPDRGETNHHELEHLLVTGAPLGAASKATYDQAVLAYRRPEFRLPRHAATRPAYRDIHDQMISSSAGRALFGDPTYAPFPKAGADPFAVETKATEAGLEVTWTHDGAFGSRWMPVDVLRAHGGWTHRVLFRFEVPREEAARFRAFRVLSVTKDGEPLATAYPTAALETWGGAVRVHGMVVLPTKDPKDRPLSGGRRYEARFLLAR
jgi:hypothetical protein